MYSRIPRLLKDWANSEADILALIMVGSYARDEARPDSDLDLVIITTTPELYIKNAFIAEFGEILKVEKEDWEF